MALHRSASGSETGNMASPQSTPSAVDDAAADSHTDADVAQTTTNCVSPERGTAQSFSNGDENKDEVEDEDEDEGAVWYKRQLKKFGKMLAKLLPPKARSEKISVEKCLRSIEIVHTVCGNDKHAGLALTKFDTGSNENFISVKWMQAKGLDMTRIQRLPEGSPTQVNWQGGGSSAIIGVIELTWYGENESHRGQIVHLKEKMIVSRFFVVPDSAFEIIIGLDTINEHRLFKRDIFSFANRTQGGKVPLPKSSTAKQREATKKKKEKEKILQDKARAELVKKMADQGASR